MDVATTAGALSSPISAISGTWSARILSASTKLRNAMLTQTRLVLTLRRPPVGDNAVDIVQRFLEQGQNDRQRWNQSAWQHWLDTAGRNPRREISGMFETVERL